MRIGLYQANIIYGKPDKNLIKLEKYLNGFAGQVVILPELFTTGYVFNQRDEILGISENIPNGKSCQKLEELAKKFKVTLVAGIAEQDNGKLYNSAVVISPEGYIGKYRKIAQTRIDRAYFERGTELFVFEIDGVNFGVIICFDIWFPSIVQSYVTKQNIDILVHIANFGGQQTLDIARARALENNLMVVTCNRLGEEKAKGINANYCGQSQIVDHNGQYLMKSSTQEALLTVDIDLKSTRNKEILGVNWHEETEIVQSSLSSS